MKMKVLKLRFGGDDELISASLAALTRQMETLRGYNIDKYRISTHHICLGQLHIPLTPPILRIRMIFCTAAQMNLGTPRKNRATASRFFV